MSSRFRTIPVVDGNGDELTLYEIRARGPLFGLMPATRLELCSGEPVEKCDGGYIVLTTREKLTPIR